MNKAQVFTQRYPLLESACTFYLLLEAKNDINWFNSGIGSIRSAQQRRITEGLEFMVGQLKAVAYDYIPIACFGEARHSVSRCNKTLPIFMGDRRGRIMTQKRATKYDPDTFMPVLYDLFANGGWFMSNYGGLKWAAVAKAWLRRNDTTDEGFVHQVLNLAHNGGPIFDKSGLLQYSFNFFRNMTMMRQFGGIRLANAPVNTELIVQPGNVKVLTGHIPVFDIVGTEVFRSLPGIRISSNDPNYYPINWGKIPFEEVLEDTFVSKTRSKNSVTVSVLVNTSATSVGTIQPGTP